MYHEQAYDKQCSQIETLNTMNVVGKPKTAPKKSVYVQMNKVLLADWVKIGSEIAFVCRFVRD